MCPKFGQMIDVDDPWIDPGGQGHRSKVNVTRSKNTISGLILQYDHGQDHMGRGLRSTFKVKVSKDKTSFHVPFYSLR